MTEENVSTETVTERVSSKAKKVRSSFTMDEEVMEVLKAKSKSDDVSVSMLIEQAVSQFLGV
jgi:hypothetical protein